MNCPDCNAPLVMGITPASKGWCSAECDLKQGTIVEKSLTYWDTPEWDGTFMRNTFHASARQLKDYVMFTVLGDFTTKPTRNGATVSPGTRGAVTCRVFGCSSYELDRPRTTPCEVVTPSPRLNTTVTLSNCYFQGKYTVERAPSGVLVVTPDFMGMTPREIEV